MKSHLKASCVRNICAKNSQNPSILLKVTIDNVGVPFFETKCISNDSARTCLVCRACRVLKNYWHRGKRQQHLSFSESGIFMLSSWQMDSHMQKPRMNLC